MSYHKLTLNFNAGELSPFLPARLDLAKYESGCQHLENFIILPYGGVIRRPGTQWLGRAKRADLPCRLIGFNFSVTTNFILEFGHLYVRFWTNGIQVGTPGNPSVPLEKATPYNWPDLQQLQYTQVNDVMYIVHPSYHPYKLSRLADDNWTMVQVPWTWPPVLDENITGCTVTPSATVGNITITSNCDVFAATDVGSSWQIGHNQAGASQTWVEVALTNVNANSPSIRVRGPWELTTFGTWSGEIRIVRTIFRTGVQETIRTYRSGVDGQRNISSTGNEDEDCNLYIAFFTNGSVGSSQPTARLEFGNARVYGLVLITGFVHSRQVNASVQWGMVRAEATIYWSKAAFSASEGYPRSVCLHEQRLVYGGTKRKPSGFWGSQIDDYDNFQRGALASHSYMFTIASNESNPIQWMVSQSKMLLGTAGAEWSASGKDEDVAMGAGNVSVNLQSNFGSAYLQPRLVNEVVLFAQRQRHKIRELVYSFEKDGWVAPDLCILANHISGDGFRETAFCQQPDAVLWCITSDGQLVGMTYERDQNVVGWHRHSTQGTFESVATIYGGDKADEVWFSVKRTVAGADVRYIERFDPSFRNTFEDEDKDKYWYLDCGFRSSGVTATNTVSGISHLNGLTVGVLGDGANQPQRVVSAGSVTIQDPAKIILVGLPFQSIVAPMNLNVPVQDGTMQGRKVRIHEMVARIRKTLTMKFSSDFGEHWDEVYFRDRAHNMDDSPPPFTGDMDVTTGAGYATQQAISIMQDRPFPCCVLAMVLWCDYYGS